MTSQMNAAVIEAAASIVLKFAAPRPQPLKPLVWARAIAAMTALSLLLGFYFVAREIEKQGELRRQAVALHAAATWRCNALPGRLARANCLTQLNTPPGKEVLVQVAAKLGDR
ncbi:MAG: hypothetical protein H7Y33_01845 [Cytophagales bacterium]|nr:hypothetical protein [Rhizobacter sp.]